MTVAWRELYKVSHILANRCGNGCELACLSFANSFTKKCLVFCSHLEVSACPSCSVCCLISKLFVCVCETEICVSLCVCLCLPKSVCVCEREKERCVCVCLPERVCVRMTVCVCV